MSEYIDRWKRLVLNEYVDSYNQKKIDIDTNLVVDIFQKAIDDNKNLNVAGRNIDINLFKNFVKETKLENILETVPIDEMNQFLDKISNNNEIVSLLKKHSYIGDKTHHSSFGLYKDDLWTSQEDMEIMASIINNPEEMNTLLQVLNAYLDVFSGLSITKILISVYLFTAASVETTRNPEKFDTTKSKSINNIIGDIYSEVRKKLLKNQKIFHDITNLLFDKKSLFVETVFQHFKSLEQNGMFFTENPTLARETIVFYKNIIDNNYFYKKLKEDLASFIKIKKEDYETANKILSDMSSMKRNTETNASSNKLIFRGMTVNITPIVGVTYREENFDNKKIVDSLINKTFTFHQISSWSEDKDVAANFAATSLARGEENEIACIFITEFTKGVNVSRYSNYRHEQEVITGGNFNVKRVTYNWESQFFGDYVFYITGSLE